MRKTRFIENCRCYHLMSRFYPPAVRLLAKRGAMRGAHQAFFLDDDEKTRRGYSFMYGNGDWETISACHEKSMREATGELLAEDGPMRPSAIRKAVGIYSGIHLSRYYLTLMLEKGVIAHRLRTPAVAPAEVLSDMSYSISDTLSISSCIPWHPQKLDPCEVMVAAPKNASTPHLQNHPKTHFDQ